VLWSGSGGKSVIGGGGGGRPVTGGSETGGDAPAPVRWSRVRDWPQEIWQRGAR
jgi:hypothetical protein